MQSTHVLAAILMILYVNDCAVGKQLRKGRNATQLLSMAGMPKFMLTQKTRGANFLGYTASSKCLSIELLGGTDEHTAILDYLIDKTWFTDLLTASTNRSQLNFTSVDADNGTLFGKRRTKVFSVNTSTGMNNQNVCSFATNKEKSTRTSYFRSLLTQAPGAEFTYVLFKCFLWLRTKTPEMQRDVPATCNTTFHSKCGGDGEYLSTKDC